MSEQPVTEKWFHITDIASVVTDRFLSVKGDELKDPDGNAHSWSHPGSGIHELLAFMTGEPSLKDLALPRAQESAKPSLQEQLGHWVVELEREFESDCGDSLDSELVATDKKGEIIRAWFERAAEKYGAWHRVGLIKVWDVRDVSQDYADLGGDPKRIEIKRPPSSKPDKPRQFSS